MATGMANATTFVMPMIDCFSPMMITSNGVWLGDDFFRYALPLFFLQLALVSLVSRTFYYIMRPLRQPMIIAEIFAGVLLGPAGLGKLSQHVHLFPARSARILWSAASLGLLFFAFMVGVELDIKMLRHMGQKIVVIGIASIFIPFAVTSFVAYQLGDSFPENAFNEAFFIYIGIALSVTPFPVVTRVLSEFKLLNSELGHVSVLLAIINEMFAWVLVGSAVYVSGVIKTGSDVGKSIMPMEYIVPSLAAFVLVCLCVARPALVWLCAKTPEGERMSDVHAGIILMGVPIAGFIADCISIHFVLGALIYGLMVPTDPHGTRLIERMEEIVLGFLMPIFFVSSGFMMDFNSIRNPQHVLVVVCIFLVACTMKVVVTTLLGLYYKMPLHESISLGFLANTKGFIVVILMGIAKDMAIVNKETFTVLILSCIVMTAISVPVVSANYKPSRARVGGNQCRNVMLARVGPQLRILSCVHNGRNVPSIIALLDLTNPTKRTPISIFALHLVELTGRASTMLITHNSVNDRKTNHHIGRQHVQSEHIVSSFETYEQHTGGVSLQVLTSIAPYSTMHEDICHVAEDKQADIIIIPFHKLQTVDGNMEALQPAVRSVNQNVLNRAPCSVAIFVDRFLGKKNGHGIQHRIALLFFGGPDDREAMACAWRMADHPNMSLTVLRFVSEEEAESDEEAEELAFDDQYVSDFRLRHLSCESVEYAEKVVRNAEDMVAAVQSVRGVHDLYIMGRSQGKRGLKLTAGLTEWSECPELGPVGDLLASEDFGVTASVMVVQQYVGDKKGDKKAAEIEEQMESW